MEFSDRHSGVEDRAALVAGNTVVLKPAELTPVSVWHFAHALTQAGLPAGALNVVHGRGEVVVEELAGHADVVAVSFTGSVAVGSRIHQRVNARHARVQLEMGGKNPVVVLDDADPTRAARIVAAGAFGLTGQACTATSRVLCTPGIHDAFVAALSKEASRYVPGDGLADGTVMGPVVSAEQLATDRRYLRAATAEGAEIVTGGDQPDGLLQPAAVVVAVEPHHRIAREEVFGPVVGVLRVGDLDAAIDVSNDVPFGLAAGIVTSDLRAAHRFIDRVQAAVIKVNRPTTGLDLNVPLAGSRGRGFESRRPDSGRVSAGHGLADPCFIAVDGFHREHAAARTLDSAVYWVDLGWASVVGA